MKDKGYFISSLSPPDLVGTGIAPFRSILHYRLAQGSTGKREREREKERRREREKGREKGREGEGERIDADMSTLLLFPPPPSSSYPSL